MENLIESRVILGLLCVVHLFINYIGAVGAYHGHVEKHLLTGTILTEMLLVAVYAVYDNIQAAPQDGWFLAIIGYIMVYALIFMTWVIYCVYAIMEKGKIYEMTVSNRVRFYNTEYVKGTVIEDNHQVGVLLPYVPNSDINAGKSKKQNVRFEKVLRGMYIVVAPA